MIVSLCPSFTYDMDLEENLGYRTPFLDADAEKIEALFAAIAKEKKADV